MKRFLVNLLIGLIHGLLYMCAFIVIFVGVYLMCRVHTFMGWIAVAMFLFALFNIVVGLLGLTILGKQILEDGL